MGRAASKGNEAKPKMTHPSDMPTPRFEHGWSNALPLDHGVALFEANENGLYVFQMSVKIWAKDDYVIKVN